MIMQSRDIIREHGQDKSKEYLKNKSKECAKE